MYPWGSLKRFEREVCKMLCRAGADRVITSEASQWDGEERARSLKPDWALPPTSHVTLGKLPPPA